MWTLILKIIISAISQDHGPKVPNGLSPSLCKGFQLAIGRWMAFSKLDRLWRQRCSVQFSSFSCVRLFDPMNRSTPGFPVHHQLPESTQTHVHWVGDAIQPSHPLPSPSPPALNLSKHQGLFKWVSSSHKVAKILEFQLQHQSIHEYIGLISFRTDWLDFLAVQGTLKSFPQHHSSKASILRHSAFFMVQLSHLYMTTGKTIALTTWTLRTSGFKSKT